MKLNNRGFALTSIVYMLIVLFLLLLLLILSNLATRKVILDKLKYDVSNKFNQGGVKVQNVKTAGEIISQELITSGDGLYASQDDSGRYIYRGANPNNYIWLDENGNGEDELDGSETYRIISFESDGTIKVIRENSIGQYAWDTDVDMIDPITNEIIASPRNNDQNTYCEYEGEYVGCNVWGNQINTYLDNDAIGNKLSNFKYKYYPNANINEDLDFISGNVGTVNNESSLNIYLNKIWINNLHLNEYLIEHAFYVGGIYINQDDLEYHSRKNFLMEKSEEMALSIKSKIGLFNITDMVNSSTNESCISVWSNFIYNPNNSEFRENYNWPCKYSNWLFNGIDEWSLTPFSRTLYHSYMVDETGYFNGGSVGHINNKYNVRPSFFLKPGLTLKGSGTQFDPYKIVS